MIRRLVPLIVLAATVASLAPAPRGAVAEPGTIAVAGNRFVRPDGGQLFLLGVNYVGGPDRSWTMWQDGRFDAAQIGQDFLKARSAGLNTVRLFVRPPLHQELLLGQWGKLDAVVALAEQHGLYLVVTLYDYREDDLARVAALDRAIARRYAPNRAILAYDLKNEPHYQDLAIAQYPGSPPPLQGDSLIQRYGERLKPADAEVWRQSGEGKNLVPTRFSSREAYIYANNYRIYREFLKEAGDWVVARNYDVSTLDYLDSPDSTKWRPLLAVLDQTLAAWLKPQAEAVREGDRARLVTVGYSDAVLARLSANNGLGFVSIHRFPNAGLKPLRLTLDLLDDLRRALPDKPVVVEEFGYSSADADPTVAAQYETAVVLHLLSQGMAGGAKWSLYDVAGGWDSRENAFGLYRADGGAKPAVQSLRSLGEYVATSGLPAGKLSLEAEPGGPGVRYVYTAADALFVAAPSYADPAGRLSFEASGVAQLFVSWPKGNEIVVAASAPATLHLNPGALVGARTIRDLTLQRANGSAAPFQKQGDLLTFSVEPGQLYRLRFTALAVDAKIEIVWPQANKPVRAADLANITAYLFERGTTTSVCSELAPTVRLWRALNNGVEEPIVTGQRRDLTRKGTAFTAWDFNNVDVAAARDPRNKYYFRLSVDGYPDRSSIWSHGEDARTYLPNPDLPTGIAGAIPQEVDAKIAIVWPHDNLPVDRATRVNVAANLFQRGTLRSAPADWSPTVRLRRTLNNGLEEEVAVGQKTIKQSGQVTFPAWEFNDVDVAAARDRLNKYYFRVTIDGVASRSNIWSHGADARTYFPEQDTPTGVGGCGR